MNKKLKSMVFKNLKIDNLMIDVIDEILEPALDKLVADSVNPFDDIAKARFYPDLERMLKEVIKEKYAELLSENS